MSEIEQTTFDTPALVALADIQPNPFQPRAGEDLAAIAEIALSIHRNGLLQIPSARAVNGYYELAFGHTRKAAFEVLATLGLLEHGIEPDPRYAAMPLYIRELDDRQMFEMALSENLKRRDLNPIEVATSMKLYMDQFGATSREAGQLFGFKDATVRGMVRLLNLPPEAQQRVATGEITQTVARRLVSIAQIDPQAANTAATRIAAGETADYVLRDALARNKDVVTMWDSWQREEPRGGPGLWPLDMKSVKFPEFEELTPADVAKAVGIKPSKTNLQQLQGYLDALANGLSSEAEGDLISKDAEQRIEILWQPPACTACPLYLVNEKTHICGFKPCHRRKSQAWLRAEARRLSKKLGIPIYDEAKDGTTTVHLLFREWNQDKQDKQLVEAKDPALRLAHIPSGYGDHEGTNHPQIGIILVGEAAEKRKAANSAEARASERIDWEAKWKRERELQAASKKFLEKVVYPLFSEAFTGMDNLAVMSALAGVNPSSNGKKAEQLARLRVALAESALAKFKYGQPAESGPTAVAKKLQKTAATWGITLPADFREIAKTYQPVSTETARPSKQKGASDAAE